MLCLPSGECMCPDATSCTTMTSALYSSVGEEDVLQRQLMASSFLLTFAYLSAIVSSEVAYFELQLQPITFYWVAAVTIPRCLEYSIQTFRRICVKLNC